MGGWRSLRRWLLAGVGLWLLFTSVACGGIPPGGAPPVDYGAMRTLLKEEQALWQSLRPAAYSFHIHAVSMCGEPTLAVTVSDDQPVTVGEVDTTSEPATVTPLWVSGQDALIPYEFGCWASTLEEFLDDYGTLDRLFAVSEQQLRYATGGSIIDVTYDPLWHFPNSLFVAHEAASEYNAFDVTDFLVQK